MSTCAYRVHGGLLSQLKQLGLFGLSLLLAASATTGCGSPADQTADPPPALAPPAPGEGIQYRMTSTIAAGQEIERCKFVQAPPEGLNINHQDVRYTPGSHHVLVYLTPYTSIPTQDQHGMTRDTTGVMDCPEGASADWQLSNVLGGAQSADGASLVSLPPGVAVKVPGNAVLLINTHYLNASPNDLLADAFVNLYTIPDSDVKIEGGVLFMYNPVIRVPAEGKASARMRCMVRKDITITNIQSHMHRRGVGYEADLLDGKEQKVSTLYTNTSWEQVPVKQFDPGLQVATGNFLDYHCDYDNPEARTVIQGPSTKDEMCMLLGSYYPRDDDTAFCMGGTIVGSGTNSCGDALNCTLGAALSGSGDNATLYGCIVDSCPAVADPLNQALQCFLGGGGDACKTACQDPTAADCLSCVKTSCQPLNDACAKATCG